MDRLYRRIMVPLMQQRGRRMAFYGGVVVLLFASMGLVLVKAVQVKMLPFDNKSEFQVVLDCRKAPRSRRRISRHRRSRRT